MTEHDLDLYAPLDDCGSRLVPKTCGTCLNFFELCCGYGVCRLSLESRFKAGERFSAYDVLDWAEANMLDSQDDACGSWEGAI